MLFQQLFTAADRECQIYRPIDVIQADTTDFDRLGDQTDNDDQKSRSKIVIDEAGILILRSTIRHIPPENKVYSTPKFLVHDAPRPKTEETQIEEMRAFSATAREGGFLIPEIDWQSEVNAIMHDEIGGDEDVEDETNPSRKVADGSRIEARHKSNVGIELAMDHGEQFMHRLSIKNVAPFSCFEPDSVTFDGCLLKDDLDILLPNPTMPSMLDLVDGNLSFERDLDEYNRIALGEKSEASVETSKGIETVVAGFGAAATSTTVGGGSKEEASSASAFPAFSGAPGNGNGSGNGVAPVAVTGAGTGAGPVVYLSRAEKAYEMTQEKLRRIREVAVGFDAAASLQRERVELRDRGMMPLY